MDEGGPGWALLILISTPSWSAAGAWGAAHGHPQDALFSQPGLVLLGTHQLGHLKLTASRRTGQDRVTEGDGHPLGTRLNKASCLLLRAPHKTGDDYPIL